MTTNWQQPPGGPPAPQPGKGKRFGMIAVLLVVIAGLAAGAGLFMANRDATVSNGDEARYVVTETVANEPVFEARDARGPNPFFPLEVQLLAFQAEQEAEILEEAEELLEDAEPGQEVEVPAFNVAALDEAVKTGLYGGTEENTCDPERLISFLYANPDLGAAWATVQGIEFIEIADYIRSLEVRVLAEPAAVLNHGFDVDSNAPYEIDTVLDAGTAVLVDKDGDIRTRCYCGNPIKPKPPEHMPPRCVVWLEHVYVSPGGGERRANAVRDVLLTNRQSTVGGAVWVEVKWGNADNERGWVRSDNLSKHYCPPEQTEWQCPGPDAVPVFANPDEINQIGWHTGTLHTDSGNTDIFGPVQPVGGLNPVISNGFMLVRFKHAAPSVVNSGWVRTTDLDQNEEDCFRIPLCVDTEGPVWERAGGAIHSAGGVMRVEFTGRFVKDAPITHAEVRLVEEGGTHAWISFFYTALADEDCKIPTYECVTEQGELGTFVYENSTGGEHLGHVQNANVTVTGAPQDGRVPIEMATPGGPDGWIDESAFTADIAKCKPVFECYITTGPAYAEFPTSGAMIGPIAPAQMIGRVGKHVHDMPGDPAHYERIEVGGLRYWIDTADLIPVAPEDCKPPTDVGCPTYGWPDPGRDPVLTPDSELLAELRLSGELDGLRMIDEGDLDEDDRPERPIVTECCVTILYETPDTSTPVLGIPFPAVVTVFGSITVDNLGVDEVWYITSTGDYFMDIHVIPGFDCVGDCPTPTRVPGLGEALAMDGLSRELLELRVSEPLTYLPDPGAGADCCISGAYTGIESGIEAPGDFPRFVEIANGPHAPAPGWYLTTDGDWFRATQVVPNVLCEQIDCPTPMTPGIYDLNDIKRGDQEDTLALTLLYPGDTAECCAEGTLYSSGSYDDALDGELSEPTTVIVVSVDGEWYQVQVDDFIAWIHVSQFVDLDECESTGCAGFDLDARDVALLLLPTCCIQGRALTVHPADATGADWISIDPAVEGNLIEVFEDLDGGPWYYFDTDEHGGVYVTAERFVDESDCRNDVECPNNSYVGPVLSDDIESGELKALIQCCVSVTTAGAGVSFKIVTLTGETETVAGVVSYETTDGDWILESDFASAGRCKEVTCPDGQTVVQNLNDCPPPTFTCENGQEVATPGACPPTSFTCPDGVTVVQNLNRCPPPPTSCDDTDSDGWCDESDNCVFNANPGQEDDDNDGRGNPCDDCPQGDRDGDSICDNQDNCPDTRNNNQRNRDGDAIGDACDNCPDHTNGFQFDDDGDGFGNECDVPDCPKDRITTSGLCCPTGSGPDGTECYCQSGALVRPGGECPPPCPNERQLIDGGCCPAGTTAGSVDCHCPDGSLPVPGVGCTKLCPDGDRIPQGDTCPPFGIVVLPEGCPSDRLRGDGVCCPKGTIAWQTNLSSASIWQCLAPEG